MKTYLQGGILFAVRNLMPKPVPEPQKKSTLKVWSRKPSVGMHFWQEYTNPAWALDQEYHVAHVPPEGA